MSCVKTIKACQLRGVATHASLCRSSSWFLTSASLAASRGESRTPQVRERRDTYTAKALKGLEAAVPTAPHPAHPAALSSTTSVDATQRPQFCTQNGSSTASEAERGMSFGIMLEGEGLGLEHDGGEQRCWS